MRMFYKIKHYLHLMNWWRHIQNISHTVDHSKHFANLQRLFVTGRITAASLVQCQRILVGQSIKLNRPKSFGLERIRVLKNGTLEFVIRLPSTDSSRIDSALDGTSLTGSIQSFRKQLRGFRSQQSALLSTGYGKLLTRGDSTAFTETGTLKSAYKRMIACQANSRRRKKK